MQPTRVLPVVSVLSLVSVEYGGWALLGFLTGRGQLGEFREKFFRAGHAHAGVLLVLSLVYYLYLDRTGYSNRVQWLAGGSLLAGILAQSGGFFIHLGLGEPNRSSLGTVVTRSGALPHRGGAGRLGRRPDRAWPAGMTAPATPGPKYLTEPTYRSSRSRSAQSLGTRKQAQSC